jgi:hypothetical protein
MSKNLKNAPIPYIQNNFYLHNNWIKHFLLTLGPLLMSLGHLDGWGRVKSEGRPVALLHMN